MSEEGLTVKGEELQWKELEPKLLEALANRTELSVRGQLGLAWERLLRGDEDDGWQLLRKLNNRGAVPGADLWGLIARYLEETPPELGYLYWEGRFVRPEQVASLQRKAELAALAEAFVEAGPDEREGLFGELLAADQTEALRAGLEARWDRTGKAIARSSNLKKLAPLAEQRTALDQAREEALALIFDTEEYFYPYRVPDVPQEKARLYPAVQRRVSELVGAVRDVWDGGATVSLSERFRDEVDELSWNRARQREIGLDLELPEEVPTYLLGLPRGEDRAMLRSVSLREFAWTLEEAEELARSRAVRAYNERRWGEELEHEDQRQATASDRRQVQITNDYRLMLGRRALAWNPRIQQAAYDHSQYMADTGNFGHFENDRPETRTPFDRMSRRGYSWGVSENVAVTGGDAGAAHAAWCRSSGHHRNILMDGHREMASSGVGRYWTQNFGVGTGFTGELD